jgi:threonyl-tRNA synthetase
MNDHKYLDNLRHSCAHLLAAAVIKLWPDTKRAIGPAIENGFYFDFEFKKPISEEDFPKIEEMMRKLVTSWKSFELHKLSPDQAKKEYPDNPFKHELIDEFSNHGKEKVSFYKSGDYWDLCAGGHCEHPDKELKHFKLLSLAGAYWRGSEKNPMLTRIYGTCFPTKQELQEYLQNLEEAKKRDHKKLGKELGLFTFSETVGKGLPLFTPKGATIRRILERFIVDEELKRGYLHVYTPDIANIALYKKSGHYPYYKDSMYAPIVIDDEEYMLRPMTCPHHFELYRSEKHSYRELPMRIAELAKLYRYEQSGELMGLLRVRTFCLADAHIICRKSQAADELHGVLDLIDFICQKLGLAQGKHYRYRLSLGDRTDEQKYYKDDSAWDHAENVLRQVLKERNAQYYEAEKEGAFYGPKIDIQMKNVNGKEDTAFTVQYDFVMPKRFELTYTNEEGKEEEPVVIHRSSIGAIERSIAFLIEHYAGAFPTWLAPTQVTLIPISEKHIEAANNYARQLQHRGFRVFVDQKNEPMQAKIRAHTLQKVPYLGIIGDREIASNAISVRSRDHGDLKAMPLETFIKRLASED